MSWFRWWSEDSDKFFDHIGGVIFFPFEMLKDAIEEVRTLPKPAEVIDLRERFEKVRQKREELQAIMAERKMEVEEKVGQYIIDLVNSDQFNERAVKLKELSREKVVHLAPRKADQDREPELDL